MGRLEIGDLKKHGRCVVGRSEACDVRLAHESISRQHAQFGIDGHGTLSIMDLSSGLEHKNLRLKSHDAEY